jgi:hypothetical protein
LLEEWCNGSRGQWVPGYLTRLKVQTAPNSSVAAVNWDGQNIRVYCQGKNTKEQPRSEIKGGLFLTSERKKLPTLSKNTALEILGRKVQLFQSLIMGPIWQLCPGHRRVGSIYEFITKPQISPFISMMMVGSKVSRSNVIDLVNIY